MTYRLGLERLEARLALAAIANAGLDQDVDRGSSVMLSGLGSTGTGALTYTWTQKSGPDVTAGEGTLSGATPTFTAPPRVTTLEFELVVTDSDGPSPPDRILVSSLEDPAHALFVSPQGSDTNTGTRAAPLLDLPDAITKAAAAGDDLYVAAGMYAQSVNLATGVSLYGGFSADSWLRDPENNVTTISSNTTAVQGIGVQDIVLDGFTIVSADATAPSGNSIAVLFSGASNIEVSGNVIHSGKGANGAGGASGTAADSSVAAAGSNGQNGCSGCSSLGGGGAQTTATEFGGKGGDGGYNNGNGAAGSVGSGNAAGGSGGVASGQAFSRSGNGGIGGGGSSGAQGIPGATGPQMGDFIATGYVPPISPSGTGGTNGKGGGGGGGGGGGSCNFNGFCTANSDKGGGGGSGGSGGLGGNPGGGGGGGGASIAVFLTASPTVSIHDNQIATANGGNGGQGGDGADGQLGGPGGNGGIGQDDSGSGGNGGHGGNGGAGGPGSGGTGGPSIGIYSSVSIATGASNTITTGTAGFGGAGGTNTSGGAATPGPSSISVQSLNASAPPPNDVTLTTSTIAENRPVGTAVGSFDTINSNDGGPFDYALVTGSGDDNNSSFAIIGDQLVTAHAIDFEGRSSLSVRVRSTDAGNVSVEKVFTIQVTDVNDPPSCTIAPPQHTTDESGFQSVPNWIIHCSANDPGQNVSKISVTVDKPGLFTAGPAVDASGTLTYDPAPNVHDTATVTITIQDDGGTAAGSDTTIVQVPFEIVKPHRFFNAAETGARRGLDVTGSTSSAPDGFIVAGDVLAVINYINAHGSGDVQPAVSAPPYVDVDANDKVVAFDALLIINWINSHPRQSEAEAAPASSTVANNLPSDLVSLLSLDIADQAARRRRL
jgi:hypothetical protein